MTKCWLLFADDKIKDADYMPDNEEVHTDDEPTEHQELEDRGIISKSI